jgi:hypothetical protein
MSESLDARGGPAPRTCVSVAEHGGVPLLCVAGRRGVSGVRYAAAPSRCGHHRPPVRAAWLRHLPGDAVARLSGLPRFAAPERGISPGMSAGIGRVPAYSMAWFI